MDNLDPLDNLESLSDSDSVSSRIPFRIKSGRIDGDSMTVEISDDAPKTISFSDVEFVCAGVIRDKTMSPTPPKTLVGSLLNGLFGGDKDNEAPKPQINVSYLLDIYVRGQISPYRINASFVNYKAFLDKVSYISLDNFKILIKNICRNASEARFNRTACDFVMSRPVRKFYVSELEFLVESGEKRKALNDETSYSDLMGGSPSEGGGEAEGGAPSGSGA